MNSMCNFSPEKALRTILDLLNEERLFSEIDEPFDLATKTCQLMVNAPVSHTEFNRVIAEYVQHIYQAGLRLPRCLSIQEAFAEAVFLLRKYRGVYTEGYSGALFDAALNDQDSIDLVLARLTETIKVAEREKYVNWVLAENYHPLDWKTKESIVETYLKQHRKTLPEKLRNLDPSRLVEHIHDLIFNQISTESIILQLFSLES